MKHLKLWLTLSVIKYTKEEIFFSLGFQFQLSLSSCIRSIFPYENLTKCLCQFSQGNRIRLPWKSSHFSRNFKISTQCNTKLSWWGTCTVAVVSALNFFCPGQLHACLSLHVLFSCRLALVLVPLASECDKLLANAWKENLLVPH